MRSDKKCADSSAQVFDDTSCAPGVWRYAHARRVRVIIDGEAYFDAVQRAMLKARQRILMIGWDFDTRIHLHRGRRWWERPFTREYPSRLGGFIPWLTRRNRNVEIRILKWSFGFLKFLGRGSMLLDLARWFPHRRIDFKFDTAHPVGCSHHQKIVIIDKQLAICGGIDLTSGRWDTREHEEIDDRRRGPGRIDYPPWHDLTMMVEGDVAGALDELGRDRWVRAGGRALTPPDADGESAWPADLDAHFENVEIGIARTRPEHGGSRAIAEIEQLHLQHIAEAKHYIYAENQYFASRKIAEAIARRLTEDHPPEIIIVHPTSAEGWMEAQAMDPARDALVEALRQLDRHGRFHIYSPFRGETPIYVHAKVTIIDDRILRIGSANLNNRSLGLDSECDLFIDAERAGNGHARGAIVQLHHSLLAEHLGLEEADMPRLLAEHGSMSALIAAADPAKGRSLREVVIEDRPAVLDEAAARQVLDPERPDEMFELRLPENGLFRKGGLLAKARRKARRGKDQ